MPASLTPVQCWFLPVAQIVRRLQSRSAQRSGILPQLLTTLPTIQTLGISRMPQSPSSTVEMPMLRCALPALSSLTQQIPRLGPQPAIGLPTSGPSDGIDYAVGILVNGYYTRNDSIDDTIIVVSKPTSKFITGGGYIINQTSAGIYAGDPGLKTNFGLNLKLNKKGSNIQGKVNIIVRQNGHVYQIKTNALISLVAMSYNPNKPKSGAAELIAKANISDVTEPLNPISIEGNATLQVRMKDNGEPGSTDLIGFTLWSSDGSLLFSSNWDGIQTIQQVLDGGNLQVH